jgi:amino acid permease
MGKGLLIAGIATLVVGIVIAAASSFGQTYTSQEMSKCSSMGGQLGQLVDPNTRRDCDTASIVRAASSAGFVVGIGVSVIGAILSIIGGIMITRKAETYSSAAGARLGSEERTKKRYYYLGVGFAFVAAGLVASLLFGWWGFSILVIGIVTIPIALLKYGP